MRANALSKRRFAPVAILLALYACATPESLLAPVAEPTMPASTRQGAPLPTLAEPTGETPIERGAMPNTPARPGP